MPEPRFHYRSDSLIPRRVSVPTESKPFSLPAETPPALVTKTTEVGVIGSTYLNTLAVSGNYRTIRFVGYGNVDSMASGLSILVRLIPRFTGFAPSSKGGIFAFTGAFGQPYMVARALNTGTIQFLGTSASFATMVNLVSVSTYSFTSGTAVDLFFSWTGTTAANGAKMYVNGTLLAEGTSGMATDYTDAKGQLYESILACNAWPQGETSNFDLNEMAVWNSVIDPTASGLNFSGSSRTSFLTSTAYDPMPTAGNVKGGLVYGSNELLTGTRVDASPANVLSTHSYADPAAQTTGTYVATTTATTKVGTSFGVSQTGTFDGSDRWTDPGIANVLSGVAYKANSVANNRTGTHTELLSTDPGIANVLDGIEYTINDVDLVGTFDPNFNFVNFRAFLNGVLSAVGTSSLTDDEYATITVDQNFEYTTALHAQMQAVVVSRDALSSANARLGSFFKAYGVDLGTQTSPTTGIYVGGALED